MPGSFFKKGVCRCVFNPTLREINLGCLCVRQRQCRCVGIHASWLHVYPRCSTPGGWLWPVWDGRWGCKSGCDAFSRRLVEHTPPHPGRPEF
jgi:hypothetical protein